MPKNLKDIISRNFDHVIIDCCPRGNSTVSPINDFAVADCYNPDNSSLFCGGRRKYTLYVNFGILLSLTESAPVKVTCHSCKSVYKLCDEDFRQLYEDYLEERRELLSE